ncbi:MAG: TlpA disulfide reductase family protein [Methylovulum sp.]|nr:TlpA disulfide reductase family protein [Methylovulum sp.]
MKRIALVAIVAALALFVGIAVNVFLSPMGPDQTVSLPPFSLPDLSGKQRSAAEWQGQIRVINFWATWCPPCRKEIPGLVALQREYAAQGVVVIGIAIDDQQAVADYLNETKINYPILMGANEGIALARELGNRVDAVPYTLIVDRQGAIIYRHQGEFPKEKMLDIIAPLIH